MRKIRLVLLGVLCAGLLVCGIGTGVTLAEVSTFSYGGQQLLESAQSALSTWRMCPMAGAQTTA